MTPKVEKAMIIAPSIVERAESIRTFAKNTGEEELYWLATHIINDANEVEELLSATPED